MTSTNEPTVQEIKDLTSRLRHLRSPEATDAERDQFISDKEALLARIAGGNR